MDDLNLSREQLEAYLSYARNQKEIGERHMVVLPQFIILLCETALALMDRVEPETINKESSV